MITLVAYKALNSVNVFFVSCWELGKYSTALKSWLILGSMREIAIETKVWTVKILIGHLHVVC